MTRSKILQRYEMIERLHPGNEHEKRQEDWKKLLDVQILVKE